MTKLDNNNSLSSRGSRDAGEARENRDGKFKDTGRESLFSEEYYISNIELSELSKEELIVLLKFVNRLCREKVPVKCVLLSLKTVIRNVDCEMVEICYVDKESNLVINYMMRELILHKKEVNYVEDGLYNSVLKGGGVVVMEDSHSDERFLKDHDQHTDLEVRSLMLIPLHNINNTIWGVLSVINFMGSSVSTEEQGTEEVGGQETAEAHTSAEDRNSNYDTTELTHTSRINSDKREDNEYYEGTEVYNDHQHANTNEHEFNTNVIEQSLEHANESEGTNADTTPSENSPTDELNRNRRYTKHELGNLKFIYELSYIIGVFINNIIEFSELEISRDKSNSLLTLMHSLFSDQLGIQSCIISLTTHAKKLIQVENCTVYIVDNKRNQLWSISSNSGEQIILPLDTNNNENILYRCVNTSSIIIYDNNYNNNKEYNNKNIVVISRSPYSSISQGSENGEAELERLPSGTAHAASAHCSATACVHAGPLSNSTLNIRNGIWIPIKNESNVLAIIEVVNKQNRELLHFTEDDLNLLELFAVIVAPQFERSEFSNMALVHKATEAGLAFENIHYNNLNNNKNFINQSIIEEEE